MHATKYKPKSPAIGCHLGLPMRKSRSMLSEQRQAGIVLGSAWNEEVAGFGAGLDILLSKYA